jgi:hypothetical protein
VRLTRTRFCGSAIGVPRTRVSRSSGEKGRGRRNRGGVKVSKHRLQHEIGEAQAAAAISLAPGQRDATSGRVPGGKHHRSTHEQREEERLALATNVVEVADRSSTASAARSAPAGAHAQVQLSPPKHAAQPTRVSHEWPQRPGFQCCRSGRKDGGGAAPLSHGARLSATQVPAGQQRPQKGAQITAHTGLYLG